MNLPTKQTVGADLVQPFDIWSLDVMDKSDDRYREHFKKLLDKAVRIGDKVWLKHPGSGMWSEMTQSSAKSTLWQHYGGKKNGILKQEAIGGFLSWGILTFDQTAMVPFAGEFVLYRGKRSLNLWRDERWQPKDISDDELEAVLEPLNDIMRLLHMNLCGNEDEKSLADMMAEVDEAESDFAWVMHWLASVYQNPGHHLNTALWFVGARQGVGKGTLVQVMQRLLGSRYVAQAMVDEIRRGWNDFADGKLLVEFDEVDISSKSQIATMLKEMIGSPEITINKRNTNSWRQPNTANWICTTNHAFPIFVEKTDRRHTFIKTLNTVDAKGRAQSFARQFYNPVDGTYRENVLNGLGSYLATINIKMEWIMDSKNTDLRNTMLQSSLSNVELWFINEHDWTVGEFRSTTELWESFETWELRNGIRNSNMTMKKFGMTMKNIVAEFGYVKWRRQGGTGRMGYVKMAAHDMAADLADELHDGEDYDGDERVVSMLAARNTRAERTELDILRASIKRAKAEARRVLPDFTEQNDVRFTKRKDADDGKAFFV